MVSQEVIDFSLVAILGVFIGYVSCSYIKPKEHSTTLGWREASVRAILAMSVVFSYVGSIVFRQWAPEGLAQLASIILGYYFGQASMRNNLQNNHNPVLTNKK